MPRTPWRILGFHQVISWNRSAATARVSIVFARTTSGAFVFHGTMGMHRTLKLSTITKQLHMSIPRDAVEAKLVDFSDIATGRRLPTVHPGEILRNEFLRPLGISVYEFASALKVPRSRVNDIVRGRRAVTADTAMRFARYFGTTPNFWINLQAQYDLEIAERTIRRKVEREVSPRVDDRPKHVEHR